MHRYTRSIQLQRLSDLLRGIESAMFTTIDLDGSVASRPMLVSESAFNGVLHFFTNRSSGKVDAIHEDSHVNLSFMDPATSRYLSLSGTAEVVTDPRAIKKYWKPAFERWFPDGVAQDDLVLIAVYVTFAEFWDTPNSDVAETFCFMTAETSKPRPSSRLTVSY